ncbi:hypothetical protein [Martelella mediterranea]|uniref:Uncharacterized protein n=1 Tax=Martelella mediterranea DSM 17316 TaxID=1122214 RepID=A0A1U9YX30_9HYPH|nr:hypothetical protein [Martelella mediterranea]AQZ49999.1 hypothetical protein Mame_00623 [Martelella mediterranea DSM 17316]
MVATAHSDPYAIFMRKIGYSVGLEYTAERVGDLASRYLKDRDITAASWHELVTGSKDEGNWGRDKSAEKHIGDFFNSLRLIHRTSGDVIALENLDAIAIASELLGEEEENQAARDFLFLWAILVNDGEIFVNLLLAGFEEQAIKDTLRAMMRNKRGEAVEYLKGKATAQLINRVITIERQEKNKGSAGGGQSVASLRRTEPLQSERAARLGMDEDDEIEFSDDYFRKVPPRRRDWAISLGLWDEKKGLTQRGHDFLDGLRQRGYIDTTDYFTFWPMDYELVRSGFRPDLFGDDTKNLWTCLVDFAEAYAGLHVKPNAKNDVDAAVEVIGEMIEVFRSLHVRKAMLRRELPITIAYPSAIAMGCARRKPVLDLPSAILAEQKGEQRRLALRPSRHTGGALSIKR